MDFLYNKEKYEWKAYYASWEAIHITCVIENILAITSIGLTEYYYITENIKIIR